MPESQDRKKTLPIQGARLVKLSFCGNGKDSKATIEVEGSPKIVIPLSNAAMDIDLSDAATVRTRGWDDSAVKLEILPLADKPLMLDEATVWFPGSDEEWNEGLRRYAETGRWALSWCVTLRIRLVAAAADRARAG
jgi:hypothetical protein